MKIIVSKIDCSTNFLKVSDRADVIINHPPPSPLKLMKEEGVAALSVMELHPGF